MSNIVIRLFLCFLPACLPAAAAADICWFRFGFFFWNFIIVTYQLPVFIMLTETSLIFWIIHRECITKTKQNKTATTTTNQT